MEDHDSERLTEVVDAVGPSGSDDDPLGMRVGPGTEVGGYVIDGRIGRGGMGEVFSATHPVIGKRAAIKILRPEVSSSPTTIERFIQEARAVNQIGHPNIVDIFAYGALPDGRAYHVMDLLVGESLRRRLKRDVLSPSEAASVIDEIAQALTAAHDHGFIHRDLKPDNVFLVTHEGRWPEVKLLDFGLAKLMPEYGASPFTTKIGVMLGTPEYMSPEQARGIGVDHRTDIYALGILMFEILAGSRPFPALGDQLATLIQHAEEPPASLADVVAGLPDEMVQLVAAMLAKTPEARPSLAAVRTVIKRLRSTQLPTRSVAGLPMQSHPRLAVPLAISPSRVGAEAVLPGDSRVSSPAQPMTTPGVGLDSLRSASGVMPAVRQPTQPPRSQTQPPSQQAARSHPVSQAPRNHAPSQAPRSQAPSQPAPSQVPRSHAPSQPAPSQVPRSHAPSQVPRSHAPSQPGVPPAHGHSQPGLPAVSQSGLRAPVGSQPIARPEPRLPSTTLGVAAPKLVPPRSHPAAKQPRRTWLVIAILLVIAAAATLVIALAGS